MGHIDPVNQLPSAAYFALLNCRRCHPLGGTSQPTPQSIQTLWKILKAQLDLPMDNRAMNHQWQPPMPRNPEFDQFLAAQMADKNKHGNLSDRKAQWLEKIDALYVLVDQLLAPYFADGNMERSTSIAEVREEQLGSYSAPTLTIDLGASSVRFMPIGTILMGAPGRVDLVGMRGSVRFVLVLPEIDRPKFTGTSLSDGEPALKKQRPLDLSAYQWKISTHPPGIRYNPIDTGSLQSAIMEAVNGRTRRR